MAAGTHNFVWEQGATIDEPIIWKDASLVVIPVTGYTARMQVRSTLGSSTILHEFTTENSGIVVDGAAGKFTIKATAVQSAGWTTWPIPGGQTSPVAVYDLEVISPTNVVTRLLKGTVTLDLEVTR